MVQDDQEGEVETRQQQLFEAYQEALLDTGAKLGISDFVNFSHLHDARSALQIWNTHPTLEQGHHVSDRMSKHLPLPLHYLLCPEFRSCFALAANSTQILWTRVISTLAGPQSIVAKQSVRMLYNGNDLYAIARQENNLYTTSTPDDHGEDNPHRQLNRLLSLAAVAVSGLVAAESALSELSILQPVIETALENPPPELPLELVSGCELIIMEHLSPMIVNLSVQPGATPPRLLPARDAAKFISDQLRDSGSTYRLPDMKASQRVWNLWFSQILALPNMYEIEPLSTIRQLLTGISPDDERVFGWYNSCATRPFSYQTLPTFVQHIRDQVVDRSTTRMDARDQLISLTRTHKDISSCRALRVRLAQLFEQLFPLELTSEAEPITYAQAVRVVHNLLIDLKKAHPVKGELLCAWRSCTEYNKSALRYKYLRESLHQDLSISDSNALFDAYLKEVYELLEHAHSEFTEDQAAATTSLPIVDLNRNQILALAAKTFDVTPKFLSQAVRTKDNPIAGLSKRSSKKRPLVAATTSGKSFSGKQQRSAQPSKGPPIPVVCDAIRTSHPDCVPGSLRTKLPKLGHEDKTGAARQQLTRLDYSSARQLVVDGACPICLEKGYDLASIKLGTKKPSTSHHGFQECLLARGIFGTPAQSHFMNSVINPWLTAWRANRPNSK